MLYTITQGKDPNSVLGVHQPVMNELQQNATGFVSSMEGKLEYPRPGHIPDLFVCNRSNAQNAFYAHPSNISTATGGDRASSVSSIFSRPDSRMDVDRAG